LLFSYSAIEGGEDDAEWISVAFALRSEVKAEMRDMMVEIGFKTGMKLEEAMGPGWSWADHYDNVVKWLYPILGVKASLLKAKDGSKEKKNVEKEKIKSSRLKFWDSPLISKL
jgi:hypothetical protein